MAKPRGMTVKDRAGEKYGRLTVLLRAPNKVEPSGAVRAMWKCVCECGNSLTVSGHALSKGHTKSCGCLMKEKEPKHGMARTLAYRRWVSMVQRCTNPNNPRFKDYGGRGITVCDQWRDFSSFIADVGMPEPGKTLDRIDNDRGYEPGNVRWATLEEQQNNRRVNTRLTYQGQTLTVAEWGRVTGFGKSVIIRRLQNGWPVEHILNQPVAKRSTRKGKD
jgi:hypothetical protein